MSESDVRTAPPRGRSSARGGRGGYGRGGPRGGRKVNGTSDDVAVPEESFEDQGEIGEMKKKYTNELGMLKDMFPDWTDTDLVFALDEADGDLPSTVDKITSGAVSQFADVKKPKDRARSKVPKDDLATAGAVDKSASTRGARGRGGFEGSRGGRGRGSERGRGGHRGGRGGHAITNGTTKDATSVQTTESSAWDTTAPVEAGSNSWDDTAPKDTAEAGQSAWSEAAPAAAPDVAKSSVISDSSAKKTWASMFAKPKLPAVLQPQKEIPATQPPAAEHEKAVPTTTEPISEETTMPQPVAEPSVMPSAIEEPALEAAPVERPITSEGEDIVLTPSKHPLTEENVEHLPDESIPPATQTVASTSGSLDPRNLTPLPTQQPPIGRPPVGGYATAAQRLAVGGGARSASFQRRVQEQQEAVVMPGHNAVDRAAVQFGSMGLSGEPGSDVDEEREEPETRQAPQHSPVSQPRASLPPAPRQAAAPQEPMAGQGQPTPKQAPGLPPASAQNQQQIQDPSLGQNLPQEPQNAQQYNQFGRYGQPGLQQESPAQPPQQQQQKPYDPFGHQAQQSHFDQYSSHNQQQQSQHQSGFGGLSSAPSEYSSYYTSDQSRNAYNPYYGSSYAPQEGRTQAAQAQGQDPSAGPQRSTSGFGAGPNESAFPSQAQQQVSNIDSERSGIPHLLSSHQVEENMSASQCAEMAKETAKHLTHDWARQRSMQSPLPLQSFSGNQSNERHLQTQQPRFGDIPGSGNNTPNPIGAQQPANQSSQTPAQVQQSMQAAAAAGQPAYDPRGVPYGHPYYNSPYHQAYQNQFGAYGTPSNHYGGGYGGGYQGKQGGMYGASQGYGAGPQASFDQHSASPANTGAFSQNQQSSMRSASGMGSSLGGGLDDYGRNSTQPSSHGQSSGYGGMNDPFSRTASGYGAQGGYGNQGMSSGADDSLKAFDNSKSGPSPALGQPGRPGSAATNAAGGSQSGLPPPQSQHSAFGGYPGFSNQGSQYGGLGGLGSQHGQGQQQQGGMNNQYAGYGGFNQTYGGYGASQRGGWGQNYGAH